MKKISRSDFIFSATVVEATFACAPIQALSFKEKTEQNMYGLIGKITAKAGQRDALIKILLEGLADLP